MSVAAIASYFKHPNLCQGGFPYAPQPVFLICFGSSGFVLGARAGTRRQSRTIWRLFLYAHGLAFIQPERVGTRRPVQSNRLARWPLSDFDGHYGSPNGFSTSLHTFLFGPEVSWPARVSPFAHVLFGGAHVSSGGFSDTSFAMAVGAGIDTRLIHGIYWRIFQGEYFRRFSAIPGKTTHDSPRESWSGSKHRSNLAIWERVAPQA